MTGSDIAFDPLIGTTIEGKYELRKLIGRGGMGAVYEAFHLGLQSSVAVKVLLSQAAAGAETVKRFHSEVRFASSLAHPNIVEMHAFGVIPDVGPYIVMELLNGDSLSEELKHKGTLEIPRFQAVFKQCCSALAAIHEKGFVHRDIKPSNIMLLNEPDGRVTVKITDFGIAKLFGDQDMQALTRTGEILGTPIYMSPEQCQGLPIDQRSDIYALGCVMYESVTGQPPFTSDTPLQVMMKHVESEPESPTARHADLRKHKPLVDAIMHTLQKEAAARPQNMAELANELADAEKGVSNFKRKPRLRIHPRAIQVALALGLIISSGIFIANYFADQQDKVDQSPPLRRADTHDLGAKLTIANIPEWEKRISSATTAFEDNRDFKQLELASQIQDTISVWLWSRRDNLSRAQVIDGLQRTVAIRELLYQNGRNVSGYADWLTKLASLSGNNRFTYAIKASEVNDFKEPYYQAKDSVYLADEYFESGAFAHGASEVMYQRAQLIAERSLAPTCHTPEEKRQCNELILECAIGACHGFEIRGKLDEAEIPAKAVFAKSIELNDRKAHYEIAAELAALYAEKGNLSKAKYYLDKLAEVEIHNKKNSDRVHLLNAIGAYAKGKYAEKRGNKSEAARLFKEAKALIQTNEGPTRQESIWLEKIHSAETD